MEALQANHECPANPHERALPFSTVHPYGPPCESRAEALGPTCLRSIARNGGSNGKRNCGNVGFAGRRLPALANYFSKQVLKSILLSASLAFGAWRLLQWRLNPHALTPRSMAWEMASTAYERQMVAALMLTALQPPTSSLPFGTRLRVTNPANNRSVTVTVTDRGPFIAGRSLDLSYGAFSRIASPGQGVARVCFAKL
jgi:hypothetical protein